MSIYILLDTVYTLIIYNFDASFFFRAADVKCFLMVFINAQYEYILFFILYTQHLVKTTASRVLVQYIISSLSSHIQLRSQITHQFPH